jgi:NTE family protein
MGTRTTAFVLSGGGSLGAVQVGMLQALAEQGIRPDLLVGTSAGAMNAAWVAGHGLSRASLEALADVWRALRRADVFPVDPRRVLGALLSRDVALSSARPLGDLVRRHAGFDDLADARIPVHFVATDLLSGRDVLISDGSVVAGVLASASIPAVFPPVELGGRLLVDGALAPHAGVTQAVALGAEVVYLLATGAPCALAEPPRSAVAMALHALTLLLEQRAIHDVAASAADVALKVLPPLCPLAVSAADFSRAAELIGRARRSSLAWIEAGGTELPTPERFLSLHKHSRHSSEPRLGRAARPAG